MSVFWCLGFVIFFLPLGLACNQSQAPVCGDNLVIKLSSDEFTELFCGSPNEHRSLQVFPLGHDYQLNGMDTLSSHKVVVDERDSEAVKL